MCYITIFILAEGIYHVGYTEKGQHKEEETW